MNTTLVCNASGAATVAAGLVVGERRRPRQRTGHRDGFVSQHAGLMPFDGQRRGRTRLSMTAFRRFSRPRKTFNTAYTSA
jgi:hypothetical protein